MEISPQVRINPETGQLEQAVFQPLDESQLQTEAQTAEQAYNDASAQVQEAEQVFNPIREQYDNAKADLEAKIVLKAETEVLHLKSQAVLDAITQARNVASQQPEQTEPAQTTEPIDGEAPSEPVDVTDRIQVAV